MISTVQTLGEIYVDYWSPYKQQSILEKSYIGLLLDEHTQKSWSLLLRNKDEFFDALK